MLIGSIQPTGLPLPFISAGATSLLVFMSAIGVVLNVDSRSRKSKILIFIKVYTNSNQSVYIFLFI